jgi:predicted nucleic acid-binding protein
MHDFRQACAHNGLIVDANLLVLLCIGSWRINFITKHRRTKAYTVADFEMLVSILQHSRRVVTTPHIFAECSNLLRYDRNTAVPAMESMLEVIARFVEIHLEKDVLIAKHESPSMRSVTRQFGMTDAGIVFLAQTQKLPVLTVDAVLYNTLQHRDCLAVNLNHIRGQNWLR